MKVNEAIEFLCNQPEPTGENVFTPLRKLYRDETINRIKLRAHDSRTVSVSMSEGVLAEMDDWIVKVALGVGLTQELADRLRAEEKTWMLSSMRLSAYRHWQRKKEENGTGT